MSPAPRQPSDPPPGSIHPFPKKDLVEWQIRVASGETLPVLNQADIPLSGHAIEARICAENVARGFLPAAGTLRRMRLPTGVGGGGSGGRVKTRVDTGVQEGDTVSVHYDPMVAKVGKGAGVCSDACWLHPGGLCLEALTTSVWGPQGRPRSLSA